jgi:hypothetical protein
MRQLIFVEKGPHTSLGRIVGLGTQHDFDNILFEQWLRQFNARAHSSIVNFQFWIAKVVHSEEPRLQLIPPFAGFRGHGVPKDLDVHFGCKVVEKFLVFRLQQ